MEYDKKKILNLIPQQEAWYDIKNKAGDDGPAEIRLFNEISFMGITAEDFIADLDGITASEINCRVNCKGGDVFDGIAIYNALRAHPAKITVTVEAIAASIASVIVQAADNRVMMTHSQMMIHDAWGVAVGDSTAMMELAELLDRQSDIIAGIYADRNGDGRAKPRFRNLMKDETWFTDEEAVAAGLADSVYNPDVASIEARIVVDEPIDWVGLFEDATDIDTEEYFN